MSNHIHEINQLNKRSLIKGKRSEGLVEVLGTPNYNKNKLYAEGYRSLYKKGAQVSSNIFHPTRHNEVFVMVDIKGKVDLKKIKEKEDEVNEFITQIPSKVLQSIQVDQLSEKVETKTKIIEKSSNDEKINDDEESIKMNKTISSLIEVFNLKQANIKDDNKKKEGVKVLEMLSSFMKNDIDETKKEEIKEEVKTKTIESKVGDDDDDNDKVDDDEINEYGPSFTNTNDDGSDKSDWVPVLGGKGHFVGIYKNRNWKKGDGLSKYALGAYGGAPVASRQFNNYLQTKIDTLGEKRPSIAEFMTTDKMYKRMKAMSLRNTLHLIDDLSNVLGVEIERQLDTDSIGDEYESKRMMARPSFVQKFNVLEPVKLNGKEYVGYYNMSSPNEQKVLSELDGNYMKDHSYNIGDSLNDIDSNKYDNNYVILSGPSKEIVVCRKRKNKKGSNIDVFPSMTGSNLKTDDIDEDEELMDDHVIVHDAKNKFTWSGKETLKEHPKLNTNYHNSFDEHIEQASDMGYRQTSHTRYNYSPVLSKISNKKF